MSKEKKLRRIVIDKLFNKNQHPMKKSTRSNAPTQSTPNQPKKFGKDIQNFFYNFQTECAIIYEPVKIKNHNSLKRSLENELNFLHKSDLKIRFKTEASSLANIPLYSLKFSENKQSNIQRTGIRSKIQSQNSTCSLKIKQKRKISTCSQIQNFETKSILFHSISPSENKCLIKQKQTQFETKLVRHPSQSIKIQKTKIPNYKSIILLEKQDYQQMTNSKNSNFKYLIKNAPKKMPEKIEKVDRVRRIQSLKNLNQNAIRKYTYKRDL